MTRTIGVIVALAVVLIGVASAMLVRRHDSSVPARVASPSPPAARIADTFAKGTTILIPTVVGMSRNAAQTLLVEQGFGGMAVDERDNRFVCPGTALGTEPAAGNMAKPGTIVLFASELPPGMDSCKPPYVFRGAWNDDKVCVTEASRAQAAQDNSSANLHYLRTISPPGTPLPYGPDTCMQGYVWRDGHDGDHVCVLPPRRSTTAQENADWALHRACPSGKIRDDSTLSAEDSKAIIKPPPDSIGPLHHG